MKKPRILVVDGSRVVRTTLAKRLEGSFGIVEEDNGESAWQLLMLDNSIVAIVSSPNPPRLVARDLLGRMRASALRRLRETPLVLLVSDDNPEASADEWQSQGIAGIMTKSMSKDAMVECLENLLFLPSQASPPESRPGPRDESRDESRDERHQEETQDEARKEALEEVSREEAPETPPADRAVWHAPLLDAEDFIAAVTSLPHEMSSDESLCVLVFGIDRLSELIGRFGADVPDLLTGRIARLLAAKIDSRDVLGRCGEDCVDVAIVSHGVDLRSGVRFGKRVCKSMATGQIAVHGRKILLTPSVGVAATSDDHAASPEELLALAQERMKQAMRCGGNSVCTELHPDCPLSQRDKALLGLFGLLGEVLEPEQKEALGMAVRPLLGKIDAKLSSEAQGLLGLPPLDDEH
ncbi:MAG: diguanylate cyclase [Candidatus Accumulibacter sp.]|nr:diguanylate cyclase [Accumulibacter sp.]